MFDVGALAWPELRQAGMPWGKYRDVFLLVSLDTFFLFLFLSLKIKIKDGLCVSVMLRFHEYS